jgi:hypothetical protein
VLVIGELLGLMDGTGFQAPEISSAEPHVVKWGSRNYIMHVLKNCSRLLDDHGVEALGVHDDAIFDTLVLTLSLEAAEPLCLSLYGVQNHLHAPSVV